jgi:hypothetical protein
MSAIIDCLNKPGVKSQAFPELVEGRRVLDFNPRAGTYGMGGPGFFGLLLEKTETRPEEWLLCTLWGAGEWMTVNGRWLEAHPRFYDEQRPLYSCVNTLVNGKSVLLEWDEFSPMVVGRTLERFACEERWCEIQFGEVRLEISRDPGTRPPMGGTGQRRLLSDQDDLRKAWVLAEHVRVTV